MRKSSEIRYPNSANLFQFCRKVLDHKFGGIRVIDQDVGQILDFDPADCSHWKKGKKNIKSIQAMKSIARHLGVDEKLVVDVASGEVDENEAFCEYAGYGAFDLDVKVIENAKKDFYRQNASNWTKGKEAEFKTLFDANEPLIDRVVNEIHEKIQFEEAPLYIPELLNAYPEITLSAEENTTGVQSSHTETGTNIRYPAGTEMRAFTRFSIAKALAPHFLAPHLNNVEENDTEHFKHVKEVQANLFAAKLLTPERLIRKEMKKVSVSQDIVSQLSETFWVSKSFMNRRLKEILLSQPEL